MIAVVYNGTSKPSARRLAEEISELSKEKSPLIFYGSERTKSTSLSHIVNVGNSNPFVCSKNTRIINNPSVIATSSNKRLARIRFRVKKVPSPQLWLNPQDVPLSEYPVVARTTHHMKGHGFWLCHNLQEAKRAFARGATHCMKFIKNTREFRLHTFSIKMTPTSENDYIIGKFAEKLESAKTRDRTIKNHDNGFVFLAPKFLTMEEKTKLENAAKKALFVFGMHYGAVDIILSKDNGNAYVLEINSTPCLTDENSNTAGVYASMLTRMINGV